MATKTNTTSATSAVEKLAELNKELETLKAVKESAKAEILKIKSEKMQPAVAGIKTLKDQIKMIDYAVKFGITPEEVQALVEKKIAASAPKA